MYELVFLVIVTLAGPAHSTKARTTVTQHTVVFQIASNQEVCERRLYEILRTPTRRGVEIKGQCRVREWRAV